MTDDPYILGIIKGYKLEFIQTPVQVTEPINPPYYNTEMSKAIESLRLLGAIVPCIERSDQFISPIFLIPKRNEANRFILNLKELNKLYRKSTF